MPRRRGVPRFVGILLIVAAIFGGVYWLNQSPGHAIRRMGPPEVMASGAIAIPFTLSPEFDRGDVYLDLVTPNGTIVSTPVEAWPADGGVGYLAWADLQESEYAGATLEARLSVTTPDHGRRETGKFNLTLPRRKFSHPVAVEIERVRRDIDSNDPDIVGDSAQLTLIRDTPQDFGQDLTVYVALSAAVERLEMTNIAADAPAREDLSRLLFRTAQRIEDGPLSDALASFRSRAAVTASRIIEKRPDVDSGLVRSIAGIAALREDAESDPGTAATAGHLLARIEARTTHNDEVGALRALSALRGQIEREWVTGLGRKTAHLDKAEAFAGMLAAVRDMRARQATLLRTLQLRMQALSAAGPVRLQLADLALYQATLAGRLGNLSNRLATLGIAPPPALAVAIREAGDAQKAFAAADLARARESALNSYAAIDLTMDSMQSTENAVATLP